MRYDCLLIDVLNVAHRYFNHEKEKPEFVSKKQVFKQAVCNFINKVRAARKGVSSFNWRRVSFIR